MNPAPAFETRDAFGRRFAVRRSAMTPQAAYVTSPESGVTLGRPEARKAAEALLKASGQADRYKIIDTHTTGPLYPTDRFSTGIFPTASFYPASEPTAKVLREALALAAQHAPGETANSTVSRARTYARYLSEGK